MELTQLKIFQAVIQQGGVTRAAEKLHRVQSNVTTRVRQLEEELGVPLFERHGRKLRLTPQGKILSDYADRLLTLADEARNAVQDRQPSGLFHLGAMESTAAVRLPAPLAEYHNQYPAVSLQLQTGNPQQLTSALLSGDIDAALIAEPVSSDTLDHITVFKESLVLVADKSHPPITAESGPPDSIIVFENGCPHRQRLENWCTTLGRLPSQTIELSSYHAMLGCVVVGMGVALIPESVLTTFPERRQLAVYPLPNNERILCIELVWRKDQESANISALKQLLVGH